MIDSLVLHLDVTHMVFFLLVSFFIFSWDSFLWSLCLISMMILAWHMFPLSLLSFLCFSGLALSMLSLLYFHLYARRKVEFSPLSWLFFLWNLLLPLCLTFFFLRGLSLDSLPLEELSSFSRWRNLFHFLLIPFLILLPLLQQFFLHSSLSLPPLQDSIHALYRDNPFWDGKVSSLLDLFSRHPLLEKIFLFLHFIFAHLLPFLHTLLWFWVFLSKDLLPMVWGLPLLLLSFLYGHMFYYFSHYVQSNLLSIEEHLQRKEILAGVFHYSLRSQKYPLDFLPYMIDAYIPLERIQRKLSYSPFLWFPLFHLFLRWITSLYLLYLFSPGADYLSLPLGVLSRRSVILPSHPGRSPCDARRINIYYEKYLREKSQGIVISQHRMLVDTSFRNEKGEVLLLGELTSSPQKDFLSLVLDSQMKVNGEKGIQYWLPVKELTFINPSSLGTEASVLFYFRREEVKKSLDSIMEKFGINRYSSHSPGKKGFTPVEDLLCPSAIEKVRSQSAKFDLLSQWKSAHSKKGGPHDPTDPS